MPDHGAQGPSLPSYLPQETTVNTPQIDFKRLASRLGYKNERVAEDSYYRFRAKLRGDTNYGNRQGRAAEKFRKKLRELGEDPDMPARCEEDEVVKESPGQGFNFKSSGEEKNVGKGSSAGATQRGGESKSLGNVGEGSSSGTSSSGATLGGERRGFYFTGETVTLDLDGNEKEEEQEKEKEKEKEKGEKGEKAVKKEIKNEPEVWEWEGAAGFKGYI